MAEQKQININHLLLLVSLLITFMSNIINCIGCFAGLGGDSLFHCKLINDLEMICEWPGNFLVVITV